MDSKINHRYELALMSSAYAGSVRYYATMLSAKHCIIDDGETNLPLRWAHNHCKIVGANGVLNLTIPLEKSTHHAGASMRDVRISEHGDWRRLHWGALFSAYGKSPFFDYIAPELEAIYHGSDQWLFDFNQRIHNLVVDFLDLPISCDVASSTTFDATAATDLRRAVGEKRADSLYIPNVPYYQIWAQKHGFSPDLSIFDLLSNTGRESLFTLMEMIK